MRFITTDKALTDEEYERHIKEWCKRYGGTESEAQALISKFKNKKTKLTKRQKMLNVFEKGK